jgi:tRNA1(Val) A37 N6-methylase TrmN6
MRRTLIGTDLLIEQEPDQAFNLDTILLAHFIKVPLRAKQILDFGTGTGALMLYMSLKTKAKITGIEIQKNRYDKALLNIEINHLGDRLRCMHKDINDITTNDFKDVDLVISNPPFFKLEAHDKQNISEEKTIARHEVFINLETIIKKASLCLKYGGSFQMIHRPERLAEIISLMHAHQLEIKRLRFVHPYLNKPANHVLIESVKNGQSGLKLDPPLILYKKQHELTNDLNKIYKGEDYAAQYTQSKR